MLQVSLVKFRYLSINGENEVPYTEKRFDESLKDLGAEVKC